MFDNIGGKLKSVAKICCYCGFAASIIAAIVAATANRSDPDVVIGILVGGLLVSWLSSLTTYGFGELIERAVSIDNKLGSNGAYRSNSDAEKEKTLQQLLKDGLITQEEYNEKKGNTI